MMRMNAAALDVFRLVIQGSSLLDLRTVTLAYRRRLFLDATGASGGTRAEQEWGSKIVKNSVALQAQRDALGMPSFGAPPRNLLMDHKEEEAPPGIGCLSAEWELMCDREGLSAPKAANSLPKHRPLSPRSIVQSVTAPAHRPSVKRLGHTLFLREPPPRPRRWHAPSSCSDVT
eukprot:TRINITY_DN1643_c0_g1_i2.p1 TRINITY_DN1643_c0_g1~~TRINITY_DN1643_c0_g1_i2.p1  ORF type:complete len:174 (+),score=32.18 TRINITY_DN1643_c0_g1_i2:212-733(+)